MLSVKQAKSLVGKVVQLEFLDHVKDSKTLFLCRLWGRITEVSKDTIIITYWELPVELAAHREDNEESCAVALALVKKAKVMR